MALLDSDQNSNDKGAYIEKEEYVGEVRRGSVQGDGLTASNVSYHSG